MPNYDKRCTDCGRIERDVMELLNAPPVPCLAGETCAGTMQRVWLPGKASSVKGDEIDVWIKHGMCWPDGSPRHFTSQSHLDREALKAGKTNYVVHQPTKNGDKNPHTVRWDVLPSPISEEDRLRRWHEHEATLTQ